MPQALAGPIKFAPGAGNNAVAVGMVPVSIGSDDIDLTAANSITGGYSARSVLIGDAGTLVCVDLQGITRTLPVSAGERVDGAVCYIMGTGNGTTCTISRLYL